MAQTRGSAIVATVLILGVFLLCKNASATTFSVGDSGGWTFGVVGWPKGKNFRAGDALVFNYSPAAHNVVVVDKNGYDTCTPSRGATRFQTGKDNIKLKKGQNYFICSFPGHCQAGMKIAVNAM